MVVRFVVSSMVMVLMVWRTVSSLSLVSFLFSSSSSASRLFAFHLF